MDLNEIQRAIEALPIDQQAALVNWLAERDHGQWDLEIEHDFSSGGAGMELLERVKAGIRNGASTPFDKGPAGR